MHRRTRCTLLLAASLAGCAFAASNGTAYAQHARLSGFSDILAALQAGIPVHYTVTLSHCGISGVFPAAAASHTAYIRTFEHFFDARFGPQPYFATTDSRLVPAVQLERGQVEAAASFVWSMWTLRAFANETVTLTWETASSAGVQPVATAVAECPLAQVVFKREAGNVSALRTPAIAAGGVVVGRRVRYSVNYAACQLDGGPSVNATAGDEVDGAEFIDSPAALSFVRSVLIKNYQGSGTAYVYDTVGGQLFMNGSVTITAADVRTDTFAPVYSETFTCTYGPQGMQFFQVD